MIDKYMNPIAEPVRLSRCPALIRELGRAAQAERHLFNDAAGQWRERMPMGVIAASYFLWVGNVLPTVVTDILYRNPASAGIPSTQVRRRSLEAGSATSASGKGRRARPGKPAVRRRPRTGEE